MRFISKVVVISLQLLNIALIIASFGHSSWAIFDSSKKLSLFYCSDCEKLKSDWTYECLARSICPLEDNSSQCSLYTDLYKSSYSYLILEFTSLLLASLFLEKLIYLSLNKYPGSKVSIYITGISMLAFHTSATIFWFGYSKAGTTCSSTNFEERPDLCISYGPALALINIPLMLTTLVFMSCTLRKSEVPLNDEIIFGEFLKISGYGWIWISLLLSVIYAIFMLASLTVKQWVVADEFKGSLIRCKDCSDVEWLSWNCLQSQYCEINNESKECKDYKDLGKASDIYIGLQAVCFILLAHYFQYLTSVVKGSIYGSVYFNYALSIALAVINLASTIGWFARSDLKANCDSDEICISVGPQLSIVSNILLIPSIFVFSTTLLKRSKIEISQTINIKHYNSIALSNLGSLNLDITALGKLDEMQKIDDESSLVKSN